MDRSVEKLLLAAQDTGIANAARAWQLKNDSAAVTAEELNAHMAEALSVMRDAAEKGLDPNLRSVSRLTGGNAAKLMRAAVSGQTMGGSLLGRICARALAVAECNAAMGRIVAAPTAGACGILPGALLTVQEEYGYTDDQLVDALFVAGAFGLIIANRASISGAQGGCQAECGSAAGMTAAALTTLRGGSPRQAADACAFALMNLLVRSRARAGGGAVRIPQCRRGIHRPVGGRSSTGGRDLPHPLRRGDRRNAPGGRHPARLPA